MIDIHCHILPDVDDGSGSLEDSILMAEMAARSGVDTIVVTPHSNQRGRFENYESEELRRRFQELQSEIEHEQIPVRLLRGTEIFSSPDLTELIRSGEVISLNGSCYYLVEFAFDEEPWEIQETLQEILAIGKVPVIAHPERYYCIQEQPNYLYEWRMLGALAQMNKGSIFGRFGKRTARAADRMLRCCHVTCIASDAHSPFMRTTDMEEIDEFLMDHFPMEYRDLLLEKNPERIITNRRITDGPPPMPVEEMRRRYW
ncbi:MAG: tyrosine-protein phosphatase [Fusicatenibacter sp.]|nr:hypothetical protein [Fusicatenibacter sp.]